ncbi:citrulline utilization hydrolase CtlX [Adhaeribacter rhizoryzae]|uniref:Amidinotransferase n=1 Tax=Adhaeribacter rhizoryzae TaxID=2607907 RepID=A0A5M6DJ49_9BACT|nr:arginine deiminase-related protein [Adhaeribacter rhizoryzae]KAA5547578.1 amidinotransferase [Adhaeribacter rhizoryzae]
MQTTSSILMVRPVSFGFNPETASTNAFQNELQHHSPAEIRQQAIAEFDKFVAILQEKGINVTVINDTEVPAKPDAIFPNNWITLHRNGTIALYPMHAPSRRPERRQDILDTLGQAYQVKKVVDFSQHEEKDKFLEGTGSMILDHDNRIVYACLSPRTDADLLEEFCQHFGYQPIVFHAYDHKGSLVYHTNVMLSIGHRFAILCAAAIQDEADRQFVITTLTRTGHEVIEITPEQLRQYAGNALEVSNKAGQHFLVISEQAYQSLRPDQVQAIQKYAEILAVPINTIEHVGGGSVRCMMAEIFLPEKAQG